MGKLWDDMDRIERMVAWDELDRGTREAVKEMEDGVNAELERQGIPLMLRVQFQFIPTDNRLDPRL